MIHMPMLQNQMIKKVYAIIIFFLILSWMVWLPSDKEWLGAFNSTNIFMGIVGLVLSYLDIQKSKMVSVKQNIIISLFAFVFAVASVVAGISSLESYYIVFLGIPFAGAFFAAYHAMHFALTSEFNFKGCELNMKPQTVFLIVFLLISAINLFVLFVACFPGRLNPDARSQIQQSLSGEYNSHHSFYHTLIVKACISVGLWLFDDINKAIAVFHVFQIFCMAGVFSFVIVTLYQKKISLPAIIFSAALYALHPLHISSAVSMMKDVLFSGAVLVFITALFRLFNKIGKYMCVNYILVFVGAVGLCLWRSNGIYAFIVFAVLFIVLFFKNYKALSVGFIAIAVSSFILMGPVLSALSIPRPDTIEHLSIPAQQIARVISAGGEFTESEEELLSKVLDIEKVPDTYRWDLSDPIKTMVRQKNGSEFIAQHKEEFIKLWINVGMRYPSEYFWAWVDQTKGFWNGGYYRDYIEIEGVIENDFGAYQTVKSPLVKNVVSYYAACFHSPEHIPILNIFCSFGLMFWIFLSIFLINIINRRMKEAMVLLPLILLVLSLFISTPVFNEFRYAYYLLCGIPILFLVRSEKFTFE